MADNYLEKREEALRSAGRTVLRRNTPSLDTLLLKNRSHRAYDTTYQVSYRQLETIVSVNNKIPCSKNGQTLRFKLLTPEAGGRGFSRFMRLGAYLPELHLPTPGTEPQAFIIICSTVPESPSVDIDLGIALQSMALKSVEIGLNALIIRAFDRAAVKSELELVLEPLAVLAIGKGTDKIALKEVSADADLRYYREAGVHYVPKIKIEDLLL